MGDATTPIGSNDWIVERLTKIDRISDASKKAIALANLACQLLPSRSEILQQALSAARAIGDDIYKAHTLVEIAPQLSEIECDQVLEEALTAAENIAYQPDRIKVLALISSQFSNAERRDEILRQALTEAKSLQDAGLSNRAVTLATVAALLTEPDNRLQLLEEALVAIQAIPGEKRRVKAFETVVLHLTEPLLNRALTIAEDMPESRRPRALAAISPQLPEHWLERALTIAQGIKDPWYLTDALVAIAPYLPEHLSERALAVVQTIEYPWARAYALGAIASQLPESQSTQLLKQALLDLQAEALTNRDGFDRDRALRALPALR